MHFVLVHGAYHGAWCWDEVRAELGRGVAHADLDVHLSLRDSARARAQLGCPARRQRHRLRAIRTRDRPRGWERLLAGTRSDRGLLSRLRARSRPGRGESLAAPALEGHPGADAASGVARGSHRLHPLQRRPNGFARLRPARRPSPAWNRPRRASGRALAVPVPAARAGPNDRASGGRLRRSDRGAKGVTFGPVPNLSHIWQRFLLTSSFFAGLPIGILAAVFGYSNLQSVDIHLGTLHLGGVPLLAVDG